MHFLAIKFKDTLEFPKSVYITDNQRHNIESVQQSIKHFWALLWPKYEMHTIFG